MPYGAPNTPAPDASQPTDATMPPVPPANSGAPAAPAAMSQPAATSSPAAPAPAASSQPSQPAAAQPSQVAHHAAIGVGVKRLFSALYGQRTEPVYNQQTGKVEDQPVQSKPGDIFRHILAGAIMGGATAEEAHARNPYMGGVGGAAVGAGAEQKAENVVQQQKLGRAQEEQKADIEQQRNQREKMLADATLAHMHTEEIHAAFQSDLMAQEAADKQNQYNDTVAENAKEHGGQVATITTPDGKTVRGEMKADDWADMVMKNRGLMNSPDPNKVRVITRHFDTSGLHKGLVKGPNGQQQMGWLDADGNPVRASERSTVTVQDVPVSEFNKPMPISKKDVNLMLDPTGKTKYFEDESGNTMMSLSELATLKTNATKLTLAESEAQLRAEEVKLKGEEIKKQGEAIKAEMEKANKDAMAANKAAWATEISSLSTQLSTLREEYKSEVANFDQKSAEDTKKQIDQINGLLNELHDRVMSVENPSKPISASGNASKKASDQVLPKKTPAAASNANAPAVDDNAVVNKALTGMKNRNNLPVSYAALRSAAPGLNDKQVILASKQLGLQVPWAEVQRMAKTQGADPNKFSDVLKANGVKVESHMPSGL